MGDLIELLPMTRRNLMGSILALCAAPAIVRASSLMPVQVYDDWTKYVREIIQYRIEDDQYIARWDILSPQVGQWHCDIGLSGIDPTVHDRKLAFEVLGDAMRHHNIAPRSLVRLPLPQGLQASRARHLDDK